MFAGGTVTLEAHRSTLLLGEEAQSPYNEAMIEDREIWACANLLLREHGASAVKAAEARAEELGAEGAPEGERTFRLIADRIRTLAAEQAEGAVH